MRAAISQTNTHLTSLKVFLSSLNYLLISIKQQMQSYNATLCDDKGTMLINKFLGYRPNILFRIQCEANAEEHEHLLEDWWFREQENEPELHTWLCINTLRVCCPPNHFGPQCLPCKGGIENPCGGNGKCKVRGTVTCLQKISYEYLSKRNIKRVCLL